MGKFNIKTLKPVVLKNKKALFKNQSLDFFKDNHAIAEALTQAILEGDKIAFHEIFSGYLSVINKEELARRSRLPIATIRRMAAGANFTVDSMFQVTAVIAKELVA